MQKSLSEIIHEVALDNNPKGLAEEMGKPYSTFMREINPYDDGAKVGAESLIPFTRATGDFAAIDFIETALGRVAFVIPKPAPGHEAIHQQLSKSLTEFGEFVAAVGDSIADGTITEAEKERCRKEGYELHQALARLIYMLRR